jgi:predicted RNA-binding Zn-ribbon protein involved in translation (DUF1610 family)
MIAGVRKLVAGAPDTPPETEFLLDGAWFRHYAVVVPDAGKADAILAELARILGRRQETRARARRAVHFVWSLPTRPAADAMARLRWIADRVNVSLAVWTRDDDLLPEDNETFDEIYSEPLKPELRILDELRARNQTYGGGADSAEIERLRLQRAEEKRIRDTAKRRARQEARQRVCEKAKQRDREKAEQAARDQAARQETERAAREEAERRAREASEQAEEGRLAEEEAGRMAREHAERQEREAAQKPAEQQVASGDPFKFACPSCGQRLEAEPEWVGLEFQCPSCGAKLTVPPR